MVAKKKFTGTSAADTLVGTAGGDVLTGLAGNDIYIVNHLDDDVVEKKNQGTDSVIASVSYVLSANVENLMLAGTALRGGGNSLANVIIGNAGINILDADAGDDVLTGGGGVDFLDGGAGFDTARYSGSFADYTISRLTLPSGLGHGFAAMAPGAWRGLSLTSVSDGRADSPDGTDYMRNVEALEFRDAVIFLDGRNNAPIAGADALATNQDAPLTVAASTLIANDRDFDGNAMNVVSVGSATHGTVVFQDGSITFTPDADYSGDASFTYRVADGRGGFDDAIVQITIAPEDDLIAGTAQDGYIAGATVFRDANANGILDLGEESTFTDGGGGFVIGAGVGSLVMVGGTDIATNLPFAGVLRAPAGFSIITPLTTIVAALVDAGSSVSEAEQKALAAFGLPAAIDLANFDPIAASRSADPSTSAAGQDVFVAGTLALNTVTMSASLISGASGETLQTEAFKVFAALARQIATLSTGQTLDLANLNVVQAILADAAGAPANATTAIAADVIAQNNAAVDTAASNAANALALLADVSQVSRIAQGEAADSLAAAGAGVIDISQTQAHYTDAALRAAIGDASGQTGDVDGPGINNAPIALNDDVVLDEDSSIEIAVLANDRDYDGDTLTVTLVSGPAHGHLNFSNGSFGYFGTSNFNGSDSFTYRVSDPGGASATATVNITVTSIGDVPSITVPSSSMGAVAYDSRATATVHVFGDDGRAVLYAASGPGVTSGDLFFSKLGARSVVASGAGGVSNHGVDISAGATHLVFSSTSATLVSGDTNGLRDLFVKNGSAVTAVSRSAAGAFANGASGAAQISDNTRYVAFDSLGDNLVSGDTNGVGDVFVKNLASGAIEVASTSAAGELADAGSSVQWISADGRTVAFSSGATNLTAEAMGGVFRKNLDTGAVERIADSGRVLPDGYHLLFTSGETKYLKNLDTSDVQAVVPGANIDVAGSWRFRTFGQTDGLYVYDVLTDRVAKLATNTDNSFRDKTTNRQIILTLTHSGAQISEDGSAIMYSRIDTDSRRSERVLTSRPVVENPLLPDAQPFAGMAVADVDSGDVLTAILTAAHGSLALSDVSAFQSVTGNGSGMLTLVGLAAAINTGINGLTYTPNPGFIERETISVSVTDSGGATATYQSPAINHLPHAQPDSASITENQSVTVDVLANDTDADPEHILTLLTATGPLGSTASLIGNQIAFDPGTAFDYLAEGQLITAAVSYAMRDDRGVISESTLSLTVTGVNDAPVTGEGAAITQVDTAISGVLTVRDVDAAPEGLVYEISSDPAHGAVLLTAAGGYAYTPSSGYSGTDTFTFRATDATGASAAGVVQVAVGNSTGTMVGTNGSDSFIGSAADEAIDGLGGDDILRGNGGADTLHGGAGRDRFVYAAADTQLDTIADFSPFADGDVLDLRGLLVDYHGDAAGFVQRDGDVVTVDADGAGNDFIALVRLTNVFDSVDGLLANGSLILV